MDISQWELGSIVNLHRSCRTEWHNYSDESDEGDDDREIVTVEINSQGVYSKMR